MGRRIRKDLSDSLDGTDGAAVVGPEATDPAAFDPVASALKDLSHLPMVPLTAPGMPAPGPDFVARAVALGEPKPKTVPGGKGLPRICLTAGPRLTEAYKQALYNPLFWLNIKTRLGWRSCKLIPGHLWGSPVVEGPKEARVMVIGKWPGAAENNHSRNFLAAEIKGMREDRGNSSKIFRDILHSEFRPGRFPCLPAEGPLCPDNWYVFNLVRFPNPMPRATERADAGWINDCLPLLHMDMRLVRPDFVLCLGSEASEAVLGKGCKVTATFGKVFDYHIPLHQAADAEPEFHTARLMTCMHPAAIMRNPDQEQVFIDGLRNFVSLITGTRRTMVPAHARAMDYRVIYHARDLEKVIEEAHADPEGHQVAVDCEWHGEGPAQPNAYLRTFQFSFKKDQGACIVLHHEMAHKGGENWTNVDDTVVPRRAFGPSHGRCQELLRKLFYGRPDGKKVRVIGHNFKADLQWLIHWGLDLRDLYAAPLDDPNLGIDPEALPGWAKTVYEGGWDTMLAQHAYEETADFKLEVVCNRLFGVDRWDMDIQRLKKEFCLARKISAKKMEGYGPLPGVALYPYSIKDVDYCRQLFIRQNEEGGLLDCDRFKQCSRQPFWISMRATLAVLEMEMVGLDVDRKRVDTLVKLYTGVRDRLLEQVRGLLNWSNFNASSAPQCRSVLFGPGFSGSRDKEGRTRNLLVDAVKYPPIDATKEIRSMDLVPIKSTGKPAQPWSKVVQRQETGLFLPGTDRESLGILVSQAATRYGKGSPQEQIVNGIRQLRFVGQTLKSVLAEPLEWAAEDDDDGYNVYDGGLVYFMQADGRVHTHLYQTKETGRMSSSRPPLQNLSSKREADLESAVKGLKDGPHVYEFPMRSVIRFYKDEHNEPVIGCEHDLAGAELYMMAVQAGDAKMIDHCQRNVLPEDGYDKQGQEVKGGKFPHPNYYDIHSSIAVLAFKLTVDSQKAAEALGVAVGAPCPPTKSALKAIGKANLRKAAKTVVFGIPYGRGDEAIMRAVEEEGVVVTMEEVALVRAAILNEYPQLGPYLEACGNRAISPGYIVNCFGRRRRAGTMHDQQTQEAVKRQFTNFPIQGGVADYISLALDRFHEYPGRFDENGQARYRLALQIHDAILARVRVRDLEWWLEEVVPECMTRIVFYRCDLDGNPISPTPYSMGCGRDLMRSWGVALAREEGLALGVPEKYLAD